MRRPSPHRTAVDALRLRAWAMPILLADKPPAPPPAVAGPAWELFAEMEWVSQPLRTRLRGAGVWDACAASARGALDRAADLERARIASARAELRHIGALATEHGWTVIVMKGGVAVAEGADIHLADVDLLALPVEARELVEALQSHGEAGIVLPREHLFRPAAPGGVGVEVHGAVRGVGDTATVVANAFPLSRHPGLWRLPPQAHLWHVLYHSVVRHPDRIARLRDLLVLRRALAECTDAEVRAVEARVEGEDLADLLRSVLRMATDAECSPVTEDCVRRRYHLLGRWRWMGAAKHARAELRQLLDISSVLIGRDDGEVLRRHLLGPTEPSCRSTALAWFTRRFPSAARRLRVSARAPRLAVAVALAGLARLESHASRPVSPA